MQNSAAFYPMRKTRDIRDLLRQSVELYGDRPAFRLKNSSGEFYDVTYKNFLHEVNCLGTEHMNSGLKDVKIAVMGANSYKWMLSYMSVVCGAGVAVPIDKDLPVDDVCNILKVSDTKAIFLDKKSAVKILKENSDIAKEVKFICFDDIRSTYPDTEYFDEYFTRGKESFERGNDEYLNREIDPEALGVLLFTSGTTGMAKGVMLCQRNICADIYLLSGVVKINPTDKVLSILPLHHTYECTSLTLMLYSGACISFCEGLRYVMKNLQEVRPTLFITVPLMLEKVHAGIMKKVDAKKGGKLIFGVGKALSNVGNALGIDISKKVFAEIQKVFGGELRLIIAGAAPMNPDIAKDFMSFGIPLYLGYGLTECAPLVIGNNDRVSLPDSVGVPLPEVEVKIINPDENGIGEICVRGPMVMLGYYNDSEETAKVLSEDGWFRTGDLGSVDENGHYRISGRIKNVIVTKNGKNIYPEEVEFHLNKSPLISESLVVGIESEENDDILVAAKIFPNLEEITKELKKQSPTIEEIKSVIKNVVRDVNKKLPSYKAIKSFDIRETEFVKTTTQKIRRHAENIKN